jgi:hypothetical protein
MTKLFEDSRGIRVDVDDSSNDWVIIKDENYRPDREEFVLSYFRKDFPDVKVPDVSKVYALCSRSAILAQWLSSVNMQYSLQEQVPTFYRQLVDPEEYKKAYDDITENARLNRDRAMEEFKASSNFKNEMSKIAEKYNRKRKMNSIYSRVITMNSTELPLTLQLAIENYTPADDASLPNVKAYAREILIQYKISLIKYIKDNPNVDIEALIKENQTK